MTEAAAAGSLALQMKPLLQPPCLPFYDELYRLSDVCNPQRAVDAAQDKMVNLSTTLKRVANSVVWFLLGEPL